jgi:hypothetical protein
MNAEVKKKENTLPGFPERLNTSKKIWVMYQSIPEFFYSYDDILKKII